jgi:hypothetical protein
MVQITPSFRTLAVLSIALVVVVSFGIFTTMDSGSDSECKLRNEIINETTIPNVSEQIDAEYTYENLSSVARETIRQTRSDGSYITSDASQNPPEFRYRELFSTYKIVDGNRTYYLTTYGNC